MSNRAFTNPRSTILIYKDLYRVAQHWGARQKNSAMLCQMVTDGFRKNLYETDPAKIELQREDGLRLISNYLGLLSESQSPAPKNKIK